MASHFAPLHLVHASVLQAQGNKNEALKSYDEALARDARNVTALLNSGVILRELMRHKESLERFNRILEIEPENQSALALPLVIGGRRRKDQAAARHVRSLVDADQNIGPKHVDVIKTPDRLEYFLRAAGRPVMQNANTSQFHR
jgi:tetratricopeptide (TPR) repeat protein